MKSHAEYLQGTSNGYHLRILFMLMKLAYMSISSENMPVRHEEYRLSEKSVAKNSSV